MLYSPKYTTAQPVKSFTAKEGLKAKHRKEKAFTESYTLLHETSEGIKVFAELRIYQPNPYGRIYGCFWQHGGDLPGYCTGSDYCGYKHETYLAIQAAGYTFINEHHLAHSPESYLLGIAAFHGLEGACVLHSHA